MEWNAKLDWAEELYTMLIVLPVPVIVVAALWFIAPRLHRRRMGTTGGTKPSVPQSDSVSEKALGEGT